MSKIHSITIFGIGSALLIASFILNWTFVTGSNKGIEDTELSLSELNELDSDYQQKYLTSNELRNIATSNYTEWKTKRNKGDLLLAKSSVFQALCHMEIWDVNNLNRYDNWDTIEYLDMCDQAFLLSDSLSKEWGLVEMKIDSLNIDKHAIVKIRNQWTNRTNTIQVIGLVLVLLGNIAVLARSQG